MSYNSRLSDVERRLLTASATNSQFWWQSYYDPRWGAPADPKRDEALRKHYYEFIARTQAEGVQGVHSTPMQEEGGTKPMKYLWSVIVVTRSGDVLLDKKVVASDAAGASFNADVHAVLKRTNLTPDDVTVLCSSLGQVKVEEKPQRVIVEKG